MAKTKKSMRALAFIITVMMIACLAPTVSFAANHVTLEEPSLDGNKVTVKGSINEGAELTMLAVRDTVALTAEDLKAKTDEWLESAIMYIDQVTSDGTGYEKTFELRDSGEGNVITVFMGGTDVEQLQFKDVTISVPKKANGTVSLENKTYVGGETVKFALEGGVDNWFNGLADGAVIKCGDETVSDITINYDGTLTLPEATNELKTYSITLSRDDSDKEYEPFAETTYTFSYISKVQNAVNQATFNKAANVAAGEDKYTITLPADVKIDEYAIKYKAVQGEAELTGNPIEVARPEEGAENIEVKIIASAEGSDEKVVATVIVPAKGAKVPAIKAENVEIAVAKDAYKVQKGEGYSVIVIRPDADTVDPKTQSIKVGDVTLFYVEKPDYYVGIVPVYNDAEAVATEATIETVASEKLVYGKAAEASNIEKPISTVDYGGAKRIVLEKDKTPSDKRLLSADVANGVMDGRITTVDYGAIKRVVLKKDADFAINEKK